MSPRAARVVKISCVTPLLLVLACAAPSYEGAVFRQGKLAYRTGALPAEWKRIRVEDANLAFRHPAGGAVLANALCGEEIDDVPLDVLLNHALFGVEKQTELLREELALDGRAALHAKISGTVDGVPIVLDLVVLKKDGCTFDFQLVGSAKEVAARATDFEAFYKSFSKLPEKPT